MSPIRPMGGRRIATPIIPKVGADGVAVAGKKGANMNGANTTAGEAAVGADATGATDRSAAGLSNRGLESRGTEMYAKDRQNLQSGAAAPSGGSQMKSVAIITGMLLLAGCVVAPVPGGVAPPVAVVAPPGVVYARPAYPLPGPGYAWTYHPRYGWGAGAIRPTAGIAAGANGCGPQGLLRKRVTAAFCPIPAQSFWLGVFA